MLFISRKDNRLVLSTLRNEGAVNNKGGKLVGMYSGAGRDGEGSAGGHASCSSKNSRRIAGGVTIKYR